MYSKPILSAGALICIVVALQSVESHDFTEVPGYSFSKFMMEVQHEKPIEQCTDFSIRVMHHIAEFHKIYARMSRFTPNIENEAFYIFRGIKDPESGIDRGNVGKIMQGKVNVFVDNCITLLNPPPIREDENEFSKIPGYFFSKAMMEVRHLQPKNKCINFSIKLMHHLADRKPDYAKISVYTDGIDSIAGGVITALRKPDGVNTNDMTARFRRELLTFIDTCDVTLNGSLQKSFKL